MQKLDHHTDAKDPKKVKKQTNQQANTPTYTLKLTGLPIPYPTFGKRKYLYFQIADSLEVFHPNLRIRSIHPSTCWGWIWLLQVDPSPKSPSTHRESLAAGPKTTRPQLSMGLCSTTPRSSGCRSANSTVGPVPMERPKRMIPRGGFVGFRPWKTPLFRCIY